MAHAAEELRTVLSGTLRRCGTATRTSMGRSPPRRTAEASYDLVDRLRGDGRDLGSAGTGAAADPRRAGGGAAADPRRAAACGGGAAAAGCQGGAVVWGGAGRQHPG